MITNEPVIAIIDTNVICRHALQDHDDHSPRANRLFEHIAIGQVQVLCPATAVFEAIHILHKRNGAPRDRVANYLLAIGEYTGFRFENSAAIKRAISFWVEQPRLDFADCYHLALADELDMNRVFTFDQRMDRFPGVERIEPA